MVESAMNTTWAGRPANGAGPALNVRNSVFPGARGRQGGAQSSHTFHLSGPGGKGGDGQTERRVLPYWPTTHVEKWMPFVFLAIHALALAASISFAVCGLPDWVR